MEVPKQDDFKWFGEGFDGFPKRLPEDCVEYIIYVIDEKLKTQAAIRTRLNHILKAANIASKKLLADYIWQREAFELSLRPDLVHQDAVTASDRALKDSPAPPHLCGRTNFGDSVADEWLVVYLLFELSKQAPDAWIRVYDTDGEFLLIEAAEALPKWLNPDIAENRVWLNNGHLRIIPLGADGSQQNLSVTQALAFITGSADKLIISPFVEDEAFARIREYPSAISSSLHRSLTVIPRRLANILHQNPISISAASEAFYLRDPIAVRPLLTKDLATLVFAPDDLVTVSVKYTKVGYAQLRSQVFDAPPAWTGVIPRLDDEKVSMGMKLTCGFEMLLADPQNVDKKVTREVKMLLGDLDAEPTPLPDDAVLATWPQTQDDEKWLDIDYRDFEDQLSGKAKAKTAGDAAADTTSGDGTANLRKMVSRFESLLKDDDDSAAGLDGIEDSDDEASSVSDSDDESEPSSTGEDKSASFDEAEFEVAMKQMMGMPAAEVEKSGLLDEARRLAVEDAEEGEEDVDEEEETRKVMGLMERELKGHGALDLNGGKATDKSTGKTTGKAKAKSPVLSKAAPKVPFGPPRPPHMLAAHVDPASEDEAEEEEDFPIGPGDEELSSDDEEFNDVDLGLAKNMLEAFKGQAGMGGPAGNMMRALGVGMPRDEGD
ncbi:hypothetical protein B0A48_06893 [Cryoendolithus antarcticus]|uniref:SGT1-domain-containing protein n=1 Tax=Cryoendolithus antarcticus TaxID=1507870 RepID=A0A1V8T9R6_9PEZI|nr:hypothetical protein B0A48_06893 [Cryoendolithus antarcticus]